MQEKKDSTNKKVKSPRTRNEIPDLSNISLEAILGGILKEPKQNTPPKPPERDRHGYDITRESLRHALEAILVPCPGDPRRARQRDALVPASQLRAILRSLGINPASDLLTEEMNRLGAAYTRPGKTCHQIRGWANVKLRAQVVLSSSPLGRYLASTDWSQYPPEHYHMINLKVRYGKTIPGIAHDMRSDLLETRAIVHYHMRKAGIKHPV